MLLDGISKYLKVSVEALKNILSELVKKAGSTLQTTEENSGIKDKETKEDTQSINKITASEKATEGAKKNADESVNKQLAEQNNGVGVPEKKAEGVATENAQQTFQNLTKAQEATSKAVDNAKKVLDLQKRLEDDAERKRKDTRDKIISVLQGLWDTVKQSFHKVFESWDRQAAHLKEIGMGRENIIELNNITSETMHATEDLVGWNISIDKAIQATNSMVSAGFSPKYMKENNKNLIMGLESAGLQLQPSTIRELGNAVFDATHVKELTQGWADLIAADTENRIDAQELSRYIGSDEYKKYISLAMEKGATREEADASYQKALREAIQWGATGKDAFNMAMMQAQANYGNAFLNIPDNLSSLIGIMQEAGTFSGDLKNFTRDFAKTIKAAYNDPEIMRRIKSINVGLVASGDFTMYDNILNNKAVREGKALHVATHEEQEAGRYESVLTRFTKWLGNDVLGGIPGIGSRSIGANSQFLTGDASFGTNFLGSLWNKFMPSMQDIVDSGDKKEAYLKEIAENTSMTSQVENQMLSGLLTGSGGAAASSVLGKGLSVITKFGPIGLAIGAGIAELAALVSTISDGVDKINEGEQEQIESEKNARESFSNEQELQKKYDEAIKKGDDDAIKQIGEQLRQLRSATNKEFLNQINAENKETAGIMQMGLWAIPAIGPVLGLIDTISGHAISEKAAEVWNGSSEDRIKEKRGQLQREVGGYAEGGVITKEQLALVGEGDKPEVILPITNPNRMGTLLDNLGILPKENNIIIANNKNDEEYETSIVEIIGKQQSDVEKILSILQKKESKEKDKNGFSTGDFVNNALNFVPVVGPVLGIVNRLFDGALGKFVDDLFSDKEKEEHFAEGGFVNTEQKAVIGEENKPELILPLTNPVRTMDLLKKAVIYPGTNKYVREILNTKTNNLVESIDFDNISNLSDSLDNLDLATSPELNSFFEPSLDKLNKLPYKDQVSELKKNNIITQQEYNRIMEQSQGKLIDSLDSLNKTVQESNRMTRNSQYIPNVSSNINRRYV